MSFPSQTGLRQALSTLGTAFSLAFATAFAFNGCDTADAGDDDTSNATDSSSSTTSTGSTGTSTNTVTSTSGTSSMSDTADTSDVGTDGSDSNESDTSDTGENLDCALVDCGPNKVCVYPVEHCDASEVSGSCVEQPAACDDVYQPVCGCDGKTYGNACYATMEGASVAHEGECDDDTTSTDDGTSSSDTDEEIDSVVITNCDELDLSTDSVKLVDASSDGGSDPKVIDGILHFDVEYSGGCEEHRFDAWTCPTFVDTQKVMVQLHHFTCPRREIRICRMAARDVVKSLNIFRDGRNGFVPSAKIHAIDELLFERRKETLRDSIVEAASS